MNKKILLVDDEPNVLEGYKRTLRREYQISIAESGQQALSMIASEGPFAVVVSDMRMPVMDGVQLLWRVKDAAPETVRMMLTGNGDQQTAIDAVNKGEIFRFLNKPCPPEVFAAALDAALEQHRLITAEKELLEQTLNNSLQVMVDILSMVNPTAFNRSTRIKTLAREIADKLGVRNAWEVEIAAMLSQIGCVTVPEHILQKIATGAPIDGKEAGLYHQFPETGYYLISRIPRMKTVAEMIASQNRRINDEQTDGRPDPNPGPSVVGSRILKIVLDYDKLLNAGNSAVNAYSELTRRSGWYDPAILDLLKEIVDIGDTEYVNSEVTIAELEPGMILDRPVYSSQGQLLLASGQEMTTSLILRLTSFVEAGLVSEKISVNVPAGQLSLA